MLTGSTPGLRSLLAQSSQPSCRLLRNSVLQCARGHSTTPRNKISSTLQRPQSMLQERIGLGSSSISLRPCRPTVFVNGTSRLDHPSVTPASPVDKNGISQVGIDLLSVTQYHQGRVSRIQRPRRALKRKPPAQRRRTLLWVMLTTKSPDRSWAAYQELLSYGVAIPHHSLHQLVRLLATIKPRTRTIHLQLLSVLKTLHKNGGRVRLWEWNTLIDSAGKQWHKTRLDDYENALDIFNKKGVLPTGNTVSTDKPLASEAGSHLMQQDPDVWTYNILLSIASRTTMPLTVRHASSLLLASGFPPDRYTHLCLLRYFAIRNDLRNVRSTLCKMKEQGLEVGLDGINACLWAYARNGRFDVAYRIYRILRDNVSSIPNRDMGDDSRYICDTVGLDNLDGLEPDEITYTMMIQALAYHGDLGNALGVFVDMLSTPNREAPTHKNSPTVSPACYKPSMTAFRGLFLGFARHGQDQDHPAVGAEPLAVPFPSAQATWDQHTLETVFAAFLRLPGLPRPTDSVVYWILVAFDKTSGSDAAKLREVWTKLEAKYGNSWGGRLGKIKRSIFISDDEKALV